MVGNYEEDHQRLSGVEPLMSLSTSAASFYLGWKIWGEAVQLPHAEEVGYMVLDHIQTSTAPRQTTVNVNLLLVDCR